MGQYDAQTWQFLTSNGLNPTAAAGVMGNLEQESNINPGAKNGIGAYGIAQWLGGRKSALFQYASSHGLAPNSIQAQLGYLWQEISSGSEGVTPGSLNAQSSPSSAADYFMNKFERPGNDGSAGTREKYANQIYQQFAGTTSPIQGTGSIGGNNLPGLQDTSAQALPNAPDSFPKTGDIISEIDQSLTIQNIDMRHPVASIAQNTKAIALRSVLVIVGLIILIFGLLAVVEKSGVQLVV